MLPTMRRIALYAIVAILLTGCESILFGNRIDYPLVDSNETFYRRYMCAWHTGPGLAKAPKSTTEYASPDGAFTIRLPDHENIYAHSALDTSGFGEEATASGSRFIMSSSDYFGRFSCGQWTITASKKHDGRAVAPGRLFDAALADARRDKKIEIIERADVQTRLGAAHYAVMRISERTSGTSPCTWHKTADGEIRILSGPEKLMAGYWFWHGQRAYSISFSAAQRKLVYDRGKKTHVKADTRGDDARMRSLLDLMIEAFQPG
jgi:hypothetical protein